MAFSIPPDELARQKMLRAMSDRNSPEVQGDSDSECSAGRGARFESQEAFSSESGLED
jgi:hypothetical protein